MRKAVVIGGTSGIGAGVAGVLAAEGWDVAVTGATDPEVARAAQDTGRTALRLDVTVQGQVDALFASFDRLDALVNCAGVLHRGEEYDIAVFERVIAVNLTGTMRICLAARPLLAESGGAIVNTASMLSYFGGPLVPAYSASKGGVAQLTKALAGRWAEDGIRVNAVAPGWIETEMTSGLRADPARTAAILGRTPQGRWGRPEEVGALVAWLVSDKARFVTGAIYPVDGGYSAM
ncbi:SDR family oxidoreductase [Rhodobacteraceae bacterium CCMM004]|nr:SDR family oxidoreductase [Rhodobacteraceae bacterium CCMM004]